MLAWLSVWSEVQTCIWPSWCHCHSSSLASVKSRLVLPSWYRLTWVVLDKGPLNGVCVRVTELRFLIQPDTKCHWSKGGDALRLGGNHRSGIELAMHHRLQWFNHLWAHRLRKRDEQPAYTPHEVWTLYLSSHNYYDHCLHFNGRFPGGPEMSSSHLVSSATTVVLQHSKVKYRIQIEQFAMYTATLLWELTCHYGITHHYLPCGRGDIPTFTPAEAGTLTSQSDALTTRPITGFCATHHSKLYTIRWF